jgi:hypothetical protein
VADFFDKILPVMTLILGSVLTKWQGNSQRRVTARTEARDLLAGLFPLIWNKGADSGYLDLQVFLSRARGRLRFAGIPLSLVQRLTDDAQAFWRAVEHTGDPEIGWGVTTATSNRLDATVEEIYQYLEGAAPWWRGRRRTVANGRLPV